MLERQQRTALTLHYILLVITMSGASSEMSSMGGEVPMEGLSVGRIGEAASPLASTAGSVAATTDSVVESVPTSSSAIAPMGARELV